MIEIREAKRHHCGMMARRMRRVHRDILESGGVTPHRELIWVFGQSSFRRSAFFNGKIVAMGGITGGRLSTQGVAWLVLAEDFKNHSITIVRHAIRLLKEAMRTRSELAATVLLGDEAALKFAVYLGFHVSHEDNGEPATDRVSRKRLAHYVANKVDIRIPAGPLSVIPMGFH